MRRRGLLGVLAGLAVSACTPPPPAPPATPSAPSSRIRQTHRISGTEEAGALVLSRLYAQAITLREGSAEITDEAGGSVRRRVDAVAKARVSLVPVLGGELLSQLDPGAKPKTQDDVVSGLTGALPREVHLLPYSKVRANFTYAITVEVAEARGLENLSGLRQIASNAILAGPGELMDASDGPTGLDAVYDVKFRRYMVIEDPAERLRSVLAGTVQAAAFRGIDLEVMDAGVRTLADPEGMLRPEVQLALVDSRLERDGKAIDALESVQEVLTTSELLSMMRSAQTEDVTKVVLRWLRLKGLG